MKKNVVLITGVKILVQLGLWAILVVLIYNLSGCSHHASDVQSEKKIVSWIFPAK